MSRHFKLKYVVLNGCCSHQRAISENGRKLQGFYGTLVSYSSANGKLALCESAVTAITEIAINVSMSNFKIFEIGLPAPAKKTVQTWKTSVRRSDQLKRGTGGIAHTLQTGDFHIAVRPALNRDYH
jgi:hypothetical protein